MRCYKPYMGKRSGLYNIVCAWVLASAPVFAADTQLPIDFKGIYEINLGNVAIAKMGLEMEQSASNYAVTGDIASTGIVKLFANHKSHTAVEASGKNFSYPERIYETNYSTKKKKKYIKLVYSNGTVTDTLIPPENRAKRPEVSAALKKNSYDPLSFIIEMRAMLASSIKAGKKDFSIDVYDGRRLTRANFIIGDQKTIRYNDKKTPVLVVTLKRALVAGFTKDELAEYDKNEPPLSIYFSADGRLMPLRLETSFWLGTLSATLVKECRTGESCLLGLKP